MVLVEDLEMFRSILALSTRKNKNTYFSSIQLQHKTPKICRKANVCIGAKVVFKRKLAKYLIPGPQRYFDTELALLLSRGKEVDVALPCVNKVIHESRC